MTKKEIIEKINEFIEWIPDDGNFDFVVFNITNGGNLLYRSYSTILSNPKCTCQIKETLDKDGDCIDRSSEVRKIFDFDED